MNEIYIWFGGVGVGSALVLSIWLWYLIHKPHKESRK